MKPVVWLLSATLVLAGCGKDSTAAPATTGATAATPADAEPVTYGYEIVNVFPHDRGAFTEGLQYVKGVLFESTGLNGHSNIRKVDLGSGRVLQQVDLSGQYFGEGIVVLGEKLYQLTWKNQ